MLTRVAWRGSVPPIHHWLHCAPMLWHRSLNQGLTPDLILIFQADTSYAVQSSYFARNLAAPPTSTSDPVKTEETVPENEHDHATGMEKCAYAPTCVHKLIPRAADVGSPSPDSVGASNRLAQNSSCS